MSDFTTLQPEYGPLCPAHGWAVNTTGIRHLRFPILQLFSSNHLTYVKYEELGYAGTWLQFRSPARTLRQLAIALRQLHMHLRQSVQIANEEWLSKDPSDTRDVALTQQHALNDECEVLLVSIFVLLRRLPDDIMATLAPILYRALKSAPRNLKRTVELAKRGQLHKLNPVCDADELSSKIIAHSTWLQMLREEDGIRDALVHQPHILQVGSHGQKELGAEKYDWRVDAHLMLRTKQGVRAVSLFPILLKCLSGACELMTALTSLIGGVTTYSRSDAVMLTGHDNDAVAFWPSIAPINHVFPLLS
jgi:hypothetical protein